MKTHDLIKLSWGGVFLILLLTGCCWRPCTVDVTLDAGGGFFTDGKEMFIMTIPSGSLLSEDDIPEPARSGWEFSGWYSDDACAEIFDFQSPVTADMTLHAGWTEAYRPILHTVSFDLNLPDGIAKPVASRTFSPGSKFGEISIPEVNDGYTDWFEFRGWKDAEGNSYTEESVIDASVTVYAAWLSKWDGTISEETVSSQFDDEVIRIRTASELAALATLVNGGEDFSGRSVIITNEIDLEDRTWTPIGSPYDNPFSGMLDGYGHSVSGISVSDPTAGGLFGYIKNADIKRLNLSGTITGSDCAGLLAAYADYLKKGEYGISEITVNAAISNSNTAGGLIGYIYPASGTSVAVSKITASGNVDSEFAAGGLIGKVDSGSLSVQEAKNFSTVSADTHSGGLAAVITDISNEMHITIDGFENSGAVSTYSNYSGGVVGYLEVTFGTSSFDISNAVNKAGITSSGSNSMHNNAGGIFGGIRIVGDYGSLDSLITGTGLRNEGTVTAYSCGGGFAGYIQIDGPTSLTLNLKEVHNDGDVNADYAGGLFGEIKPLEGSSTTLILDAWSMGDFTELIGSNTHKYITWNTEFTMNITNPEYTEG